MHVHWVWAALAALALGVGLAWWMQSTDSPRLTSENPHRGDAQHRDRSQADTGPTLYRWVDARGVVNISTDRPPVGRRYTVVHIDPDQNIVPMSDSDSASGNATKPH